MTIKIFVADDHTLIREGIVSLLKEETEIEVIGQAGTGREVLGLINNKSPDVLLLDLNMPDMDGMDVIKRIRLMKQEFKILVLTVYEDDALLREAIKNGANGYLIKRAASEELIRAINYVMKGYVYIYPSMTRSVLEMSFISPIDTMESILLTAREKEILRLIVRGYSNREVSELLMIALRTAEKHRANIMKKMGVHNYDELIHFVKENEII